MVSKLAALISLRSRHRLVRASEDRGEIIPFVIMSGVLLILIAGAIGLTRVALAKTTVAHAAQMGAREASIARSESTAKSRATSIMETTLEDEGVQCRTTRIHVDTSAFSHPVGTSATVSADVTCLVPLGDLVVPGMPGAVTVSSSARSPLDTYRERP